MKHDRHWEECDFLDVSGPKPFESGFAGSSGGSCGPFGTDQSSSRAKYGPIMSKIRTKKSESLDPKICMDEYPWTVYFWHVFIDHAHVAPSCFLGSLSLTGLILRRTLADLEGGLRFSQIGRAHV